MKWMGGWSYEELLDCPADLIDDILDMMQEQVDDGNQF